MATYVLIHGAASDRGIGTWSLPSCVRGGMTWWHPTCRWTTTQPGCASTPTWCWMPSGDRVVVARSLGGFTAPLVCDRVPVSLLILVAAMVPLPGESAGDWWANTGHEFPTGDLEEVFLHDVPPDVAPESALHNKDQSGKPFEKPWPLDR